MRYNTDNATQVSFSLNLQTDLCYTTNLSKNPVSSFSIEQCQCIEEHTNTSREHTARIIMDIDIARIITKCLSNKKKLREKKSSTFYFKIQESISSTIA